MGQSKLRKNRKNKSNFKKDASGKIYSKNSYDIIKAKVKLRLETKINDFEAKSEEELYDIQNNHKLSTTDKTALKLVIDKKFKK